MGERGTFSILLTLRDSDKPLIIKDLNPIIANNQTLRRRLDSMEEEGLIDLIVVLINHKAYTVSLTNTGKDVALLLNIANNLVSPEKKTMEKSLDMRHADSVLRILRGKKYVVQKDILEEIKSYTSIKDVLDSMVRDGLVRHTLKTEWPREDRYSLTVLGEQIAEIYQAVWEKIDAVRLKG